MARTPDHDLFADLSKHLQLKLLGLPFNVVWGGIFGTEPEPPEGTDYLSAQDWNRFYRTRKALLAAVAARKGAPPSRQIAEIGAARCAIESSLLAKKIPKADASLGHADRAPERESEVHTSHCDKPFARTVMLPRDAPTKKPRSAGAGLIHQATTSAVPQPNPRNKPRACGATMTGRRPLCADHVCDSQRGRRPCVSGDWGDSRARLPNAPAAFPCAKPDALAMLDRARL